MVSKSAIKGLGLDKARKGGKTRVVVDFNLLNNLVTTGIVT